MACRERSFLKSVPAGHKVLIQEVKNGGIAMKHGICLTTIYPDAITDSKLMGGLIRKVRDLELFQCVEIYFEGSPREEAAIQKTLADAGITAVYLGGLPVKRDGIDLTSKSERVRQKSVEMCKRHMDHANRMGCSRIVIASGRDWEETGCREQIAECMRGSLGALDRYVEGSGIQICLEPFPVKTEPYLAVGESMFVYEIFTGSDFRNVGITFDTSHFLQIGENLEESFLLLKPWISHIHLANCVMKDKTSPLYGDKHPLFCQEGGSLGIEDARAYYQRLNREELLQKVEICSVEIISRGREDWYFDAVCKEAESIWR